MSHFEPEFFSSASSTSSSPSEYYPNADFLAMKPYHDLPDLRSQGFSPISSSGSSLGRSTSVGPSSKGPSRSPPVRQRTPIRHGRLSTSRARPDALLAYAQDQSEPPQSIASYPTSFGMSGSYSQNLFGTSQPPSYSFSSAEPNSSYIRPSYSFPPASAEYPYSLPNVTSEAWPTPSVVLPPPPGFVRRQTPIDNAVRVVHPRPKPSCYQHGCGGRQFSTFSNLLRHQREKSGSASKHECPHCGTVFTRTTARKGHMEGGKCKGRARETPRETQN